MGLDGSFHVVLQRPVLRVGDVADAQQLLDLFPAFIGHRDIAVLFVDHKIAGKHLGLAGSGVDLFAFFQLGYDAIDLVILVGGFLAGAGNNQRRPGFVDQDGIDFVDNGEIVPALHAVLEVELHVVAQVVEAEFVVGAVGDIGGVGFAALVVIEIVHDHADREAQEAVELAHPLGVALGQIVVDRDHVHATPAERVQINRKRCDQSLALAGLHLGNRCRCAEPCRR